MSLAPVRAICDADPVSDEPGRDGNDAMDFDAVVIGAGFAGLYALHRLRNEMGMTVRAYEAGGGVGGTWFWNRYPGARCDSESFYYCYSFSDGARAGVGVVRAVPRAAGDRALPQPRRRPLRPPPRPPARARASSPLRSTTTSNAWEVRTDRGDVVTARFVVTAVGCLSATNVPDIPGLDTFAGECYLTAQWPREGVDLAGQAGGPDRHRIERDPGDARSSPRRPST